MPESRQTELRLLFPDTYEDTAVAHGVDVLAAEHRLRFLESGRPAMTPDEIVEQVLRRRVDALMIRTLQIRLDGEALRRMAGTLKLISFQATGCENIDLAEATAAGIAVANVPITDYAIDEVVEFTFALLLAAAKKIVENHGNVSRGRWRTAAATDCLSLAGKTLGIVGFGQIGSRVARLARAFRMRVCAAAASPSAQREQRHGVSFLPLDGLLRTSDFVVLAVPLTAQTRHLLDREALQLLKQSAVVVNVCRGAVADEAAVAAALHAQRLFAYATDVFSHEPAEDSPLFTAPNVVLSPHIAWKTRSTVREAFGVWFGNVGEFAAGRPRNIVNPEVLPG